LSDGQLELGVVDNDVVRGNYDDLRENRRLEVHTDRLNKAAEEVSPVLPIERDDFLVQSVRLDRFAREPVGGHQYHQAKN